MTMQLPTAAQPVPFLDLGGMHASMKDDLLAAFADLVDSSAFTGGPQVAAFEDAFATYCGTAHCVGTASGLDAIRLALIAAGVGRGDEVIVPAQTFVATLEAVTQAGATPVVVDVDPTDYCLDAAAAATAITPATRALLPVHLYGQLADLRALGELAARHDLVLVEDACQAHGAERDGLRAGAAGLAGAFSFYPGKNLGAFGDGGALVTGDAELAARVRALREHGQTAKYRHDMEGWTSRLDTIQAIVLLRKLRELEGWNEERRALAARYADLLDGVGDLVLPPIAPSSDPVWHLYVVRTADPDALAASLREQGIATGRHYPQPVHLTDAYRWLGHRPGAFPVAEALAREGLSLPLYPGLSEAAQVGVAGAIARHFRHGGER
ncbi:MAG: DegT/DnrJ/EryC1/StrS family aminotransferase [Thermoleophilia bacterium]